jgi:hypothetical protein
MDGVIPTADSGSPALLMKTPLSRSGTAEIPLENEDCPAGCRPESPKVRENPDSEPVSIAKPEPTVAAGQGSRSHARTTTLLGTQRCARSDVGRGMWRDGASRPSSGARTSPVKTAIVGWATAELPAAGCSAGRDMMSRLLSRSSQASPWRRWIGCWGSDEPVADDPAARADDYPLKGGPDISSVVHNGCFNLLRSIRRMSLA